MAPFILPSSCPVPLAEKHPQSICFPPACFTVGMVFLGLYSAFLFLLTRRVELMPNSSILVSSDHITFSQASSGSSRCSLANFRQVCTCAFFSRGTLHEQQIIAHPSLVQFYNSVPDVLRQVLYLAHGGNVGMWLIVWTDNFYTATYRCNKLTWVFWVMSWD